MFFSKMVWDFGAAISHSKVFFFFFVLVFQKEKHILMKDYFFRPTYKVFKSLSGNIKRFHRILDEKNDLLILSLESHSVVITVLFFPADKASRLKRK